MRTLLENHSEEVAFVQIGDFEYEIAPGETKTVYGNQEIKSSSPITIIKIPETESQQVWV